MTAIRRWALPLCLALACCVAGCKRTSDVNTPNPPGGMPPGGMPPGGMPPMGGPPKMPKLEETAPHAAGKKVYNANGCAACHTVNRLSGGAPKDGDLPKDLLPKDAPKDGPFKDSPPKDAFPKDRPAFGSPMAGPLKGPDLSDVGAKPEHTVEWLIAYLRDPRSKKPNSRMPPFDKLKEEDLRALAEFLVSLK